jgi:hypothetical protein
MFLDEWPCRTINKEGFQQVKQRLFITKEMQTGQWCRCNELHVLVSIEQLLNQLHISIWVIQRTNNIQQRTLAAPKFWDKYVFSKLNHLGQSLF